MEKKKYQIPALTVVALQQQAALMQGSGVDTLNDVAPEAYNVEAG